MRFILMLLLFLALPAQAGIVSVALDNHGAEPVDDGTWVVAPHRSGFRDVRCLFTVMNCRQKIIMQAPVGAPCYEFVRNMKDPADQRQWRLWREGGKSDGRAIGQIKCRKVEDSTITALAPKPIPVPITIVPEPAPEPPPVATAPDPEPAKPDCQPEPITLPTGWVVAKNRSKPDRPVWSVTGEKRKELARAPVGSDCREPSRELQTGKSRQWRLWPVTGDVVGEVYCEPAQ